MACCAIAATALSDAAGMRKGLIADLGPAAEAINRAALTAERMARRPRIENCSGGHRRDRMFAGVNSRGGICLGSRLREITREEVRAAVDRARSIALPADREVLHLLPQQFILDEQPGIHDPIGMVGNRLEVNLHISTCSAGAPQSVVTCANRAGLEVTDTVFEGIAAAEATLSADERELGVCLLDIGRIHVGAGRVLRGVGGAHVGAADRRRPLHQRPGRGAARLARRKRSS